MEDTEELARFRHQWRCDLGLETEEEGGECGDSGSKGHGCELERSEGNSDEAGAMEGHSASSEQAAELYWMGVAAERSGDFQNSVMYYRQAIQMVPDIDFRVSHSGPVEEVASDVCRLSIACENMTITGPMCQPERPCTGTHISHLPTEVVTYILRWVVSSELDGRSLEQCSMVCRGFHVLARDPALWKRICLKLWGEDSLSTFGGNWRELFLKTPHLHFNGVYISKSTYVRQGEKSLDGYYKPYHTVVYYRYLRFFADGSVMYQTSPEDPATVVAKLSRKHSSDSVHLGRYTVQGSQVLVDIASLYSSPPVSQRGKHGRNRTVVTHEHTFHLDLQVKGAHFTKLVWQDHYCHTLHRPSGHVQVTQFTIDYKYTPFVFSRVRSYLNNSHSILV